MKSCSKIQMLGVLVLLGLLGSFSGVKPFTPEPLRAGQGTIHNDRLIFSPTLYGYNTQDFLETKPGILKDYRFIYHGEETSAAEVIEFYAYYYSINPQVFLTLLELQSRLLTKPNPPEVDLTYAMGYRDSRFSGFGEQVEWAARMLYQKYYEQLDLAASEQLQVSGQDEAGTVALLNLMETANNGQLNANSTSDQFQDTYRTLFGDSASAPINDGLQTMAEPAWKFPFKYGETWYYTGGPHYGGFGSGPWGGSDKNVRSSVDFAPGGGSGCFTSNSWIAAAAGGNIIYSDRSLILIDHGGGWTTFYYHVAARDKHGTGSVTSGTPIGHPSCEVGYGGYSTGSHVHVNRLHNGQFQNAHGWQISGWEVHQSNSNYNGTMVKSSTTKTASTYKSSNNAFQSDNATDPDDERTISYGQTLSGQISPVHDKDDYYFNGTSGDTITIRMSKSGGSLDTLVKLYKPDGSLLSSNDDIGGGNRNSQITIPLPSSGQYTIRATGFSTSVGTYTLKLTKESTGDSDDRRWLAFGQTRTGTINPNNDRDLYYFSGSAGTVVSIRMNKNGSSVDSYLELYNSSGSRIAINDDGGGNRNSWLVKTLPSNGVYRIIARSYNYSSSGNYTLSLDRHTSSNLALNKSARASSTEFRGVEPYKAFDGASNTRWSSKFRDPSWIYVNLGSSKTFDKVILRWETAYAKRYGIYYWNGSQWVNIYWTNNGNGGIDTITFSPKTARYVLMYGVERGTPWGYSLWEFEIYNTVNILMPLVPPDPGDKTVDTIVPLAPLGPSDDGKEVELVGENDDAQEDFPLAEATSEDNPSETVGASIPFAEILSPGDNGYFDSGITELTFEGYAVDNDEDGGSIMAYEWYSSKDGLLSTEIMFTIPITSLSPGVHTVSFKAQDNEGDWSEVITSTLNLPSTNFDVYLPLLLTY